LRVCQNPNLTPGIRVPRAPYDLLKANHSQLGDSGANRSNRMLGCSRSR